MMTLLKTIWDKFGWAILACVPILGFWIGRQRALAEKPVPRVQARAAQRQATRERNKAQAQATAAADAARASAAADAAGDDAAVVAAHNKRRGRPPKVVQP